MHDPKLKPGTNYCLCASCGEYFGGVRAFEMHRSGPSRDRSCLAPARVSDKHGKTLLELRGGYWRGSYGK